MTDITFFELHLDDASITANAPFSAAESPEDLDRRSGRRFLPGRGGSDDDSAATATSGDGDSGGFSPLPVLLGVGALVVAVLLARRIVGGKSEPVPE